MTAIVVVLGAVVFVLAVALVWAVSRRGPSLESAELRLAIKGLETRLAETSGDVREKLSTELLRLQTDLKVLQTSLEERKRLDEEVRGATARIEATITGARRGQAGENILGELLRELPPSLIECDFKVKGRPVEFALVLSNRKRLPLDSKFPALDLLERFADEPEESLPALRRELEHRVLGQADRVASYIDHDVTLPFAVMAVPDSAYSLLSIDAISRAYRKHVHILSYGMAVPFLLSFYSLCLQYSSQIDPSSLNAALERIVGDCERVRDEMENKISRGQTMINNAYTAVTGLVQDIERAVYQLRSESMAASDGAESADRKVDL